MSAYNTANCEGQRPGQGCWSVRGDESGGHASCNTSLGDCTIAQDAVDIASIWDAVPHWIDNGVTITWEWGNGA
jgi:hypothetical protein